jgi:group I intron endonuclease
MIGIYCIRLGDKFYVGQAVNIQRRWTRHRNALNSGTHSNQHLQNAWSKYGSGAFEFEVIEICDKSNLLEREDFWMNTLNSIQAGFNLKSASTTWLGGHHKDEVRQKISLSHTGKIKSPETCAKISASKKGKKLSEEQRRQISESLKGNTRTRGYKQPQEVRDRVAAANRGKKRSDASIANYKNAHANRSDEEKQRISELIAERARKRWQDPVQREKLINSIKEGFRKKKESTETP